MVALTILGVMILVTTIGVAAIARILYLQIQDLDEKYEVLVKHYYEPVKNVANTLKEDETEENKRYAQTPFDIINDLLEGRVSLEDETKRTVE